MRNNAWFVNNAQVTATNVNVQAATAYSLLIANDHATWGTTTELENTVAKLTPVSTVGEIASAAKVLTSSPKVGYGDDTTVAQYDVEFVRMSKWEANFATAFEEVSKTSVVSGTDKFFYSDTLWLKSAQEAGIYLDKNGVGISWKGWDNTTHTQKSVGEYTTFADFMVLTAVTDASADPSDLAVYNKSLAEAQALMKTLRVGFMVTTKADAGTGEGGTGATRKWFEYQLASDNISTAAINTTLNGGSGAEGLTMAVNASGNVESITMSSGTMSAKTIEDYCADGKATDMATVGSADKLANVEANEIVKVDVYVWMEGCDYDTIASHVSEFSKSTLGAIQFGFCIG